MTIRVKPRHKFNAKPTVVDGIRFASQKEARRYGELKLLEKAGEIHELHVQPSWDLTVDGTRIGEYRADFGYCTCRAAVHDGCCNDSQCVFEDVKSPATRTPIYRWKIKHLKAEYGIQIREL